MLACMLLLLTACSKTAIIDTSSWRYYSFEELGIAMRLPDDMTQDMVDGLSFAGSSPDFVVTVRETNELYADMESLAARVRSTVDPNAEIITINEIELVRSTFDMDIAGVQYDLISPNGDTYRIQLSVVSEADEEHSKAVLSAVMDSIRSCDKLPGDVGTVHISSAVSRPDADYLVLVNKRRALPEGWKADLVRTTNPLDQEITVERTACKAFFGLQRALAADDVTVELISAYSGGDTLCDTEEPGYSEHDTGLALDLYLSVDGMDILDRKEILRYSEQWESVRGRLADYGFILRYPGGGEYDTGHDYAPWHIRYVGVDVAREITERDVTLEEYLGADPVAIDYLVLVNPHAALPDTWEDEVEIVYMTNRHGEEIGVERTAYTAYCKLRDALAEEGVHLDINSAYRSVAAQQALVESYLKKYGKGYVDAYVAVPGYSEHHTGLALDLYLESMDVWAKIHAKLPEFGFILRYPEGKEDITGYAYEPWHVRYVGMDTAEEITSRGITLEEYLDVA